MLILQLPLTEKWFFMTKSKIKKEDYRLITPYFCNRFLLQDDKKQPREFWRKYLELYGIDTLKKVINKYDELHRIKVIPFQINLMTKGYPKKTNTDSLLNITHKGIKIDYGNPNWGAEPNVLYFVIMHNHN